MPLETSLSGMIGSPARAGAATTRQSATARIRTRADRTRALSTTGLRRLRGSGLLAPPHVLHDPVRVADRLAAEHEERHALLPAERPHLGPVAPAPGHTDDPDVLPRPAQLARHAPAGAQ